MTSARKSGINKEECPACVSPSPSDFYLQHTCGRFVWCTICQVTEWADDNHLETWHACSFPPVAPPSPFPCPFYTGKGKAQKGEGKEAKKAGARPKVSSRNDSLLKEISPHVASLRVGAISKHGPCSRTPLLCHDSSWQSHSARYCHSRLHHSIRSLPF